MKSSTLPAVLGGSPVRTQPYPPVNEIGDAERKLVNEVLDTGILSAYVAHDGPWFNGGRMVKALEEELCTIFGVKYAVTVNSATSGLHCAVAAALAGLGDEVIVPPYTMSATATTVALTNATPVFADIRPDTFTLDVDDVRRKLSPRTKAIVAVNLFGGPAHLAELRKLADERGIVLIEDNAQGPGAHENGKLAGTIGHMGILSFNCHKTVQCGEGGAVLTNDPVLADRLRLMRNHGEVVQDQRGNTPDELRGLLGYNYRLTELHSAVALAQIRRLEELTVGRIQMANTISAGLKGVPGITPPFVAKGNRHVYYLYAMRVEEQALGLSRAAFHKALLAEGISCAVGYVKPIYLYPMYDARVRDQKRGFGAGIWHPPAGSSIRYEKGACPVTERMHEHELLSTTICRADLTNDDALEMVRAVEKIVEHRDAVRSHFAASK